MELKEFIIKIESVNSRKYLQKFLINILRVYFGYVEVYEIDYDGYRDGKRTEDKDGE